MPGQRMLKFAINQGRRGYFHSMLSASALPGKRWRGYKRYLTRLIPPFKFWHKHLPVLAERNIEQIQRNKNVFLLEYIW